MTGTGTWCVVLAGVQVLVQMLVAGASLLAWSCGNSVMR